MLERNLPWEGRAEVVAVALEADKERPRWISQKRMIEEILICDGPEGEVGRAFGSEGDLLYVLVKKGEILWRDFHLSGMWRRISSAFSPMTQE